MENTFVTAVGRRKTASARVKVTPASKNSIVVNGKPANEYFKTLERASIPHHSLIVAEGKGTFSIEAKVLGGGIVAQAEAVRHAIARALTKIDTDLRAPLKKAGFLKRDPRAKERKKPGLKKARKRPQWSKR